MHLVFFFNFRCIPLPGDNAIHCKVISGVLANMKLALSEQVHVNGLKGLSPLVNLPGYDLVRGQAVEYMHGVLLGVTRQMASFWFDTSNSGETFYIGKIIFMHLHIVAYLMPVSTSIQK